MTKQEKKQHSQFRKNRKNSRGRQFGNVSADLLILWACTLAPFVVMSFGG